MRNFLLVMAVAVGALALGSGSALASSPSSPSNTNTPSSQPKPKTYTVQPGDNLSAIAQSENLDSWVPLWNVNRQIQDPNLIYAGQVLTVPTGPTTNRPLPADTTAMPARTYVPSGGQLYSYSAPAVHPAPNYAAGAGGLMARIRERESGGNYAENTGNGYYGAYQFSLGTWESVGGKGLPSKASPAEQDMRAQILYNERGCSPWPNTCY